MSAHEIISTKLLENQLKLVCDTAGLPIATDTKPGFGLDNGNRRWSVVWYHTNLYGGDSRVAHRNFSKRELSDVLAFAYDFLTFKQIAPRPHENPPGEYPAEGHGKFTVAIDTENDSFGAEPEGEVARILAKISHDLITSADDFGMFRTLFDSNGNDVGRAKMFQNKEQRAAQSKRRNRAKGMDTNPRRKARKNPRKQERLYARVNNGPYSVQVNNERDNADVYLTDRDDNTIAEWHDDDARSMVEDGFFVANKGKRRLQESVIEYARSVGLIK
jgi:ribosomal protein L18